MYAIFATDNFSRPSPAIQPLDQNPFPAPFPSSPKSQPTIPNLETQTPIKIRSQQHKQTMSHPSLTTLRTLLERDTAYFATQRQRLEEIQATPASKLSKADRNALQNWDKSVIKDCERQLLVLEEIENPTSEEREVMRELHKLVVLGDHIVERRNAVWAELEGKLKAEGNEEGVGAASEKGNSEAEKTSSEHDAHGDSKVAGTASPEPAADSMNASASQEGHSPGIAIEQDDEVENTTDPLQTDTAIDPIDQNSSTHLSKPNPTLL